MIDKVLRVPLSPSTSFPSVLGLSPSSRTPKRADPIELARLKVLENPLPGATINKKAPDGTADGRFDSKGVLGYRYELRSGQLVPKPHKGIDLGADAGTVVKAAGGGRVAFKLPANSWAGDLGLVVEIYHGSGVVTRYCHLENRSVQFHARVARGDTIGEVGTTGNAATPHLHFEVTVDGVHVDPAVVLNLD